MAVTDKPPRSVPYVEYDEAPALARRAARAWTAIGPTPNRRPPPSDGGAHVAVARPGSPAPRPRATDTRRLRRVTGRARTVRAGRASRRPPRGTRTCSRHHGGNPCSAGRHARRPATRARPCHATVRRRECPRPYGSGRPRSDGASRPTGPPSPPSPSARPTPHPPAGPRRTPAVRSSCSLSSPTVLPFPFLGFAPAHASAPRRPHRRPA